MLKSVFSIDDGRLRMPLYFFVVGDVSPEICPPRSGMAGAEVIPAAPAP